MATLNNFNSDGTEIVKLTRQRRGYARKKEREKEIIYACMGLQSFAALIFEKIYNKTAFM